MSKVILPFRGLVTECFMKFKPGLIKVNNNGQALSVINKTKVLNSSKH